jgi:hypothetical protein
MSSEAMRVMIIEHFYLNDPVTSPATLKMALFTDSYADDDSMTEVTGGSYVQQTITFGAIVDDTVANDIELTFANMPACDVVSGAVYISGGALLNGGNFSVTRSVQAGQPYIVQVGEFIVRVR